MTVPSSNTSAYSKEQTNKAKQPAKMLIQWVIMFVLLYGLTFLGFNARRAIHIIAGFSWWSMVFFIVFILLPVLPKMSKNTQYELIGFVIPRVFNTATVVGFITVGLGWWNAMEDYANWQLQYFVGNGSNILFLVGITMVTGLYLFHVFLEQKEIEVALSARGIIDEKSVGKEKVDQLLSSLQKIPRIGFTIMTTAVIIMFIH